MTNRSVGNGVVVRAPAQDLKSIVYLFFYFRRFGASAKVAVLFLMQICLRCQLQDEKNVYWWMAKVIHCRRLRSNLPPLGKQTATRG